MSNIPLLVPRQIDVPEILKISYLIELSRFLIWIMLLEGLGNILKVRTFLFFVVLEMLVESLEPLKSINYFK